MIPEIQRDGLLPDGRHVATLDEIRQIFVEEAPFSSERRLILTGLQLHLSLMREMFSAGAAWINGGFVTRKTWSAPKDVDIIYVLSAAEINALDAESAARLASLLTLQGVSSAAPPIKAMRVQPMGGLLDAFLVVEEEVDQQIYWDRIWGTVMAAGGVVVDGVRKGYLEVAW